MDLIVTSASFLRQNIMGDFQSSGNMHDLMTVLEGVRKGAPDTFVYVALPLGEFNISHENAIRVATQAMDHGADGVYFSGCSFDCIRALRTEMIPVFGHSGMIPWFKNWEGGCRAVGKTAQEAMKVYHHALKMQEAGCVALELECVPEPVATAISSRLIIPTLSMGSGNGCDGQYLFTEDLLGRHDQHYPRHSICYARQLEETVQSMKQYVSDVHNDWEKTAQKSINIPDSELKAFKSMLEQE